jgi:hypothetical protein
MSRYHVLGLAFVAFAVAGMIHTAARPSRPIYDAASILVNAVAGIVGIALLLLP